MSRLRGMSPLIKLSPKFDERLEILSRDSQYDLACSCGTNADEHRRRSSDHKWIYPVSLPGGHTTFLFKTLLSNECISNCKYCPLRARSNARRSSLDPEELAKNFLDYYKAGKVGGLFLSSAIVGSADNTMERINRTAMFLRKTKFKGYIHLKIIPGASDEAIRQSISLASAVSLNIETPGEANFKHLGTMKNYENDIVHSVNLISRLTAKGSCYERVKQTTQFVVGASHETDKEIIDCSWKLYKKLSLSRIYFSAYQRGAGASDLPGEVSGPSNKDLLIREHRLYQVDWLMRKYAFEASEIPLDSNGNLSLAIDPKEMWAMTHPEFFPVNINSDDKYSLLRVPGLGEICVSKILAMRKSGVRIHSLNILGRPNKLLKKARRYISY